MDNKERLLEKTFQEIKTAAIGFSGGVDSTYLLYMAHKNLENLLAITIATPDFTDDKKQRVEEFVKAYKIHHEYIDGDFLWEHEGFLKNGIDRCYICKKEMFTKLKELAHSLGYQTIMEGTNADDVEDFRPGRRALDELMIESPLKQLGFSKADIRSLSKKHGLSTHSIPAEPCIATRVQYGLPLEHSRALKIVKLEGQLKHMGFQKIRVRDHGEICRIEVDTQDFERFKSLDWDPLIREAKDIGFTYVTLDLEGFRSGSMNEVLSEEELQEWK